VRKAGRGELVRVRLRVAVPPADLEMGVVLIERLSCFDEPLVLDLSAHQELRTEAARPV